MTDVDRALNVFNVAVCVGLGLLAAWGVLSDRFKDGVLFKAGLILLSLGFFGTAATLTADITPPVIVRSLAMLHGGLVVLLIGWCRNLTGPSPRRRISDWMDLEDAQRRGP